MTKAVLQLGFMGRGVLGSSGTFARLGKNESIISCMKYQRDVTNDKACHINCLKLEGTYNKQVNMRNFFIFCLIFMKFSPKCRFLCKEWK